MANENTAPVFKKTGFGIGASVSTASTTLTGASATDVVTAGSAGAIFEGATVLCVSSAGPIDTYIYFYHDVGGTKRLIGRLRVFAVAPTNETPAFEATFRPASGPFLMESGDKIAAMPYSGSSTYHITPFGGDM
jgi:hypothetical protein